MATIKAVVYAKDKKQDGTYNVKIRVTHGRKIIHVSTSIYVTQQQLTRSFKIKDARVIDKIDALVGRWRQWVGELGVSIDALTVRQVVDYLRDKDSQGTTFRLDIIDYMRQIADKMPVGTARNYRMTANALARFTGGQPLDVSSVTVSMLRSFTDFLSAEPSQRGNNAKNPTHICSKPKGGRAISLYLGILRATHNRAKEQYNDEDRGIIAIPGSPFSHFRIPADKPTAKRALNPDIIQAIINYTPQSKRAELARDCFLLSFGLIGMNAADLYTCPKQDNATEILYYRQKTTTRRSDKAIMRVRVEPQIESLVKKYRDTTNKSQFIFSRLYSTHDTFSVGLNSGLTEITSAIAPGQHITFYAARHTWATLAYQLEVDKYIIHESLNHVDQEMKATDIYIDRDWSRIWSANSKIINMFDWTAISTNNK